MVSFLCIFFPPVISVILTAKLRKENFNNYQYIAYYVVFTVIINGVMFWILSFMFKVHSISSPDVFQTSFSAKYITLSSFLAIISAHIAVSFRKFKSMSVDQIQKDEIQENTEEDE